MSNILLEQSLQMWVILALIILSMFSYANSKIPLELTSAIIFSFLLLFFYFFPVLDEYGNNKMNVVKILSGFANPALISIVSLLIIGRAVIQTGAIYPLAYIIAKVSRNNAILSFLLIGIIVVTISAFLNNTPVVVIFIPIIGSLAKKFDIPTSKVMIPLSYLSILGGITTIIGSSTNILVSGAVQEMGFEPLEFFDFLLPGAIMASVGFIYIFLVAPFILPNNKNLKPGFNRDELHDDHADYISQLIVNNDSGFIGKEACGLFAKEQNVLSVIAIHRGEEAFLPPFDKSIILRLDDIIVISSKRSYMKELVPKYSDCLLASGFDLEDNESKETLKQFSSANLNITEVIIPPSSSLIGKNFNNLNFYKKYKCIIVGIKRQSNVVRSKLSSVKFKNGDILLVLGNQLFVEIGGRSSKDIALLGWSSESFTSKKEKIYALLILFFVVLSASLDFIPISIASFIGATLASVSKCIDSYNIKQAIDTRVVLIIATSLALGSAMQDTGGALFIADFLVNFIEGIPVLWMLSILFITMVFITNILSNNASAVLFTPIAIEIATNLGADPRMFIYAVIFACNCSFVTPIGYQTNLLVMGPGEYQFNDYIKVGFPLVVLMFTTYILFVISYF